MSHEWIIALIYRRPSACTAAASPGPMNHISILVADGSRARFFTPEKGADQHIHLRELSALGNAEHSVPTHEIFEQGKSASRGGNAGRPHVLDDHRGAHRSENDKRFAGVVEAEAMRLVREQGIKRFVIVAEPRELGRLRKAFVALGRGVELDEVPHDLAGRSASEIARYLTERGMLASIALGVTLSSGDKPGADAKPAETIESPS